MVFIHGIAAVHDLRERLRPSSVEGRSNRLAAGLETRLRGPDHAAGESEVQSQREDRIAALRHMVAGMEGGGLLGPDAAASSLPLGVPELQAHLAGGTGLACGVLHEIAGGSHPDEPAAFGFGFALTACAQQMRTGPAVLVASRRALSDFGRPYGHGLARHGLDVARLLLVETRTDQDALWAMEEALRAEAGLAMVMGAIAGDVNLTISRRLNLAAAVQRTPLVLLRPPAAAGTSAAATRWRIRSAPAARDRYGTFARWRWLASLERCRNGRPGEWLIEWDHVSHRFGLAEGLADRAPAARPAGLRRVG